jgi:hypothetical protein
VIIFIYEAFNHKEDTMKGAGHGLTLELIDMLENRLKATQDPADRQDLERRIAEARETLKLPASDPADMRRLARQLAPWQPDA